MRMHSYELVSRFNINVEETLLLQNSMREEINLSNINVGGQAVIEGVMMRSPHMVSTAVRRAEGEIVVKNEKFISLTQRNKILGLPLIRGLISFVEMLVISIRTLNYSAEIAMSEGSPAKGGAGASGGSTSLTTLSLSKGRILFFD